MSRKVHQNNRKNASKPQALRSEQNLEGFCFEPNCPDYGVSLWWAGVVYHRDWTPAEEKENFRLMLRYATHLPAGFADKIRNNSATLSLN